MYLRLCVKKNQSNRTIIIAITRILVKPFRSLLSPPTVIYSMKINQDLIWVIIDFLVGYGYTYKNHILGENVGY